MNILEAILEAGLRESVRLCEASSCEVFGKPHNIQSDESSAMHPQTPYGKAKFLSQIAVKHYRQSAHALDPCLLYIGDSAEQIFMVRQTCNARVTCPSDMLQPQTFSLQLLLCQTQTKLS